MNKSVTLIIIFLTLILSFSGIQKTKSNYDLTVTITGLKNNTGQVALKLYNNSKGFLDTEESVVISKLATITSKQSKTTFKGLKPGNYAVALIHDENKNQKMDKSFVGIPKEGFGFSSNPKIRFSEPSFDECKIEMKQYNKDITIKIIYY